MASKQSAVAPDYSSVPPIRFEIKGMKEIDHETFELSGVPRLDVDWRAVAEVLGPDVPAWVVEQAIDHIHKLTMADALSRIMRITG